MASVQIRPPEGSADPGRRPPATVAEYVLEAVRHGILEGRYPPGSRLDQQALAEEYGTSIIPVREGLRQLEADGLVRIAPRRGAYVADLSASELGEIYRIREVLERLATQQATERIRADDLADLEDRARLLEAVTDAETWNRLNREWHFRLYEVADSPLLLQLVGVLWDRCSLYPHVYPRRPERRAASLADHKRILAACREGRGVLAGQATVDHIRRASREVLVGAFAATPGQPVREA